MSKIIYVPLEHIEGRYTIHMDRDIEQYLQASDADYVKVMPDLTASDLPEGCFLNAAFTSRFKAQQLAEIASMYERGEISDGDTFFFSDIWFPGIESIAYINYFNRVDARITGIIHAGSFTDTDFVRDMERWAKNFEDIVFDISHRVFCASNFIRDDILRKRIVGADKLVVTGLPVDYAGLEPYLNTPKQDRVVFNGRLCDEKQPWLFDELERQVKHRLGDHVQFVRTQEQDYSKSEYYQCMAESKVVVSYALQENFGFGIAEAAYLGCTPVLPNRLVYPELYDSKYLYNRFEDSVEQVCAALQDYQHNSIQLDTQNCISRWFEQI